LIFNSIFTHNPSLFSIFAGIRIILFDNSKE